MGEIEPAAKSSKRGACVLYVDDDVGLLEISKEILKADWDINVATVSSVDEALEEIKTQMYDVVISDYEMPNKDGLQFLKLLREEKDDIPFILFTGKGREDVAIKALNLGADYYLNKHGSPETVYGELAHAIKAVDEKHKIKDALVESEKRYRSLMEQAADAILIHDANGKLVDVNEKACKNLQYTKTEMLSKNIRDISPVAAENKQINAIWDRVLAGDSVILESVQQRKNKSTFPIEVTLNSIIVDKEKLVMAIARDLTEHKRAEGKIGLLQEFGERLINSISDALIVIDPYSYKILDANEAALKQLKTTKEKLVGELCYVATHHRSTPCSLPRDVCPLKEMLETGKTAFARHVHFDSEDNEINVEVSVNPVKDITGKIVQAVHISRIIRD